MKYFIVLTIAALLTFTVRPTIAGDDEAVVEVVTFKPNPGVTNERLVRAAFGVQSFMEEQGGYLGRQLIETAGGTWIDIVRWENMGAAKRGEVAAQQSDICLLFFSMIDSSTMSVHHGGIRLEQ